MGQVIKFPEKQDTGIPVSGSAKHQDAVDENAGAKVLFFTGVRYERPLSLPSNRLAAPVTSR